MLEEFKKFILRGNMVDLAVGVIIGSAFGKVVEKFSELIMSVIGKLLSLAGLGDELKKLDTFEYANIKIGPVVTQAINLVLVGFALFLFIKAYNRFLVKPRAEPSVPPAPSATEKLLIEIRDELRKRGG
jgi:large conductance mechanosensitive channel